MGERKEERRKKMKIIIGETLPQWIMSSDKAAYHPPTKTIYIRRDLKYFILIWIHEIGHYLIDIIGGQHKAQMFWENLWGYKCCCHICNKNRGQNENKLRDNDS